MLPVHGRHSHIENHLFLIMIRLGLLFLHQLFHVVEHLKELGFMLLWWLDIGASVIGGMWLIVGR